MMSIRSMRKFGLGWFFLWEWINLLVLQAWSPPRVIFQISKSFLLRWCWYGFRTITLQINQMNHPYSRVVASILINLQRFFNRLGFNNIQRLVGLLFHNVRTLAFFGEISGYLRLQGWADLLLFLKFLHRGHNVNISVLLLG
jgi:hypothetical protein